jgi:hypothetical protein
MKKVSTLIIFLFALILFSKPVALDNKACEVRVLMDEDCAHDLIKNSDRAECQLTRYEGKWTSAYISDIVPGFQIVQYFNPYDCGASPTYPFLIESFDIVLTDNYSYDPIWPCTLNVIVYDPIYRNDSTIPGPERYSFNKICD